MTQCGWGAKGKDNRTAARSLINIKKNRNTLPADQSGG